MADEEKNVVDSWEEINEDEMFEQSQAVREPKKAAPIIKGPMVLLGEDGLRSQYLPPEPSVKILKRPSKEERLSAASELCNGGGKPVKTLRQREAEYAEARQRIMGESNDDPLNERLERVESSSGTAPSTFYTLLRPPADGVRSTIDNVIRQPRGPDSSPGFSLRR